MQISTLNPRSFLIPGFLDKTACLQLIALAESHGFHAADVRTTSGTTSMPTVRNNDKVLVESPAWVATLWDRLRGCDLPLLDNERAYGLPRQLRFYRYGPGQRFKMHKDGPWREVGLTSKLTFLVYLNDDFSGGATDFKDITVRPQTGTALLFIHDTWHEGAAVTEGTKYVLRSDILYQA